MSDPTMRRCRFCGDPLSADAPEVRINACRKLLCDALAQEAVEQWERQHWEEWGHQDGVVYRRDYGCLFRT